MENKYFIAWHPESQYDYSKAFKSFEEAERWLKEMIVDFIKEKCEIRPVRIVDEEAVREMWDKIFKMDVVFMYPSQDEAWGKCWDEFYEIIQSILPQPTEGK